MFGRIDHIGVAVEDLDEAVALYEGRLGMPFQHRETVEERGVEAVLLGVGESHVELLRPLARDTAVGRFLESGPGLHHVAYGTDDIESALEAARSAGLRLIDERPRTGIRQSRVAFVHPKSTGGVLTRARGGSALMADETRRIDIGFQGGQVLPARVKQAEYDSLSKALGDDSAKRWARELETQDSMVAIDLSQVVYVRIDTDDQRVGF